MPIKTIEVPAAYHTYAQQLRRFLRREIPLQPPLWTVQLTSGAVQLRGDWCVGPTESAEVKLALIPGPLSQFLKGEWLALGEVSIRLHEPSPIVILNSTHLDRQRLELPHCDVGTSGLSVILTAIEPHDEGLLLHMQLPFTRVRFTAVARFPVESA